MLIRIIHLIHMYFPYSLGQCKYWRAPSYSNRLGEDFHEDYMLLLIWNKILMKIPILNLEDEPPRIEKPLDKIVQYLNQKELAIRLG